MQHKKQLQKTLKYGGTLTPAEAMLANEHGEIPEDLHKRVCGTKFADRLAAEYKKIRTPLGGTPEQQIMSDWLDCYGHGGNALALVCFKDKYARLIAAHPSYNAIPGLWDVKNAELAFMAACAVSLPNPPVRYQRMLDRKKNRNTGNRAEWERKQQEKQQAARQAC